MRLILEYGILVVILIIGLIVWSAVFNAAVIDYLDSSYWITRGVWLGRGEYNLFGFVIPYEFEGYTDYSFFYVHWGHNMLRGVMPYCDEFGYLELNGIVNRNGLYIFPPLTAVFYALGIAIPVDSWGIGLLITILGFLTVFPVYGLGRDLSRNRHVGEAAALTYLLNPNVLYHTVFAWTNPAPFIFFFFSGMYMLVRGKRHTGTLLIVTAALFKQTAWFLGIPLVVYLLMRSRSPPDDSVSTSTPASENKAPPTDNEELPEASSQRFIEQVRSISREYLDLRAFMISVILVLAFVAAIMYPFVIAQPQFWNYMRLAAGGFPLESFTEVPSYGSPMRLQVLPVVAGLPTLAQILDILVYSGGLLLLGLFVFTGIMIMEPKYMGNEKVYLRRLIFFTMLMMLWVNLMGPRGVFKYYFTLFAPFFSIFSSAKMCASKKDKVSFSISMLWIPIVFSLLILIPQREIYLVNVLLIFLAYLLAPEMGRIWHFIKQPGRKEAKRIETQLETLSSRFSRIRKWINNIDQAPRENFPPKESEE